MIVRQSPDFELGQPGQVRTRHPGREHQADRIGGQPPAHEPERLCRGVVEPLLVIHQADQRLFFRYLGQQAQHGQPHQEAIRRWAAAHPERGPQRVMLRYRHAAEVIQHGRAQLVQPGKGQLHFCFHARRARHPAPPGAPGQVVQQHGLAYARLAAQHQRPAFTGADGGDETVEFVAFGAPVREPFGAAPLAASAHTASRWSRRLAR